MPGFNAPPGPCVPPQRDVRKGRQLQSILAFAPFRLVSESGHFRGVFGRCLALLALVVLGSGCSTINVAYTAGPTVLGFMADGYLDLDAEQGTVLKERILAIREWNRSSHMSDYAGFLAEVRAKAGATVTPEDVAGIVADARKRWVVMAERVAGEIAEVAPQLTIDNVAAMRKKFARNNATFIKDVVNGAPEKQREKRFDRVKEESERWYGSFDDAQEEKIRAWLVALPVNYPLVLEDRRRRQEAFAAIIEAAVTKKTDRAETRARLLKLMTDWEAGRSPAYQAFASRYQAETHRLTANIVNLATPAQRETMRRRAQRWIDDMAALAARPAQ